MPSIFMHKNVTWALNVGRVGRSNPSGVVVQVICRWRFQFSPPEQLLTLCAGQQPSTQETCILCRSPSTSARRFCPLWLCTSSTWTSRRLREDWPTKRGSLFCCATPGWKVGAWSFSASVFTPLHCCSCIAEDPVYMPQDVLLEEYVQSDYGVVYMGTETNVVGRPWSFGQVRDALQRHLQTRARSPTVLFLVSMNQGSWRPAWSFCRSALSTWVTVRRTTWPEQIPSTSAGWSVPWWEAAHLQDQFEHRSSHFPKAPVKGLWK